MRKILHFFVAFVAMFVFATNLSAKLQTTTIGPATGYGFLNGPNGLTWTYLTSLTAEKGYYTYMEIDVYNENNQLVCTIADSLNVEGAIGVRQVLIQPNMTKKFFNYDNNYEIMVFVYANTADYKGKYLHYIYSLNETQKTGKFLYFIEGSFHMAENMSVDSYSEAYTMIFQREEKNDDNYLLHYDVYVKASYASEGKADLKHTFTVDYANISSSGEEPPSILMINNSGKPNYVVAQYEKPYFVFSEDLNQDMTINENNSLIINYYNDKFELKYETKIPVQLTLEYLYTFLHLGSLDLSNDIILNYDGANTPTYVITMKNYQTATDSYIYSYALYDVNGNKLKDIVDKVIGAKKMSSVVGQPDQWLFSRDVNDGVFTFIDMPSCELVAELPLITKDEVILSTNIDRYPKNNSYQYAIALLMGEVAKDGSAQHRVAWYNIDGSLDHFDVINLGMNVENAMLNISAEALNPWLFDTDDAREYMVIVTKSKEGTTAKEKVLRICNTNGEIVAEFLPGEDVGGDLGIVNLINAETKPVLMCPYSNGPTITLQYTELPLNNVSMEGEGTPENPYKIAKAYDFTNIVNDLDACYEVVNDIDFNGVTFSGVRGEFTGCFDGGNFEIKNAIFAGGGLFHILKDSAVVENIVFSNPIMRVTSKSASAGLLADIVLGGFDESATSDDETSSGFGCTIKNIHAVNPRIVAEENFVGILGGLFGEVSLFTKIEACSMLNADIYAPTAGSLGGIIGKAATSTLIKSCAFGGKIEAGAEVGGIVSSSDADDIIVNCHVSADLLGKETIGGVVATSARSKVANCYVEGNIEAVGDPEVVKVGGVIGAMGSTLQNSTDALVFNNVVDIEEIQLPTDVEEMYAHRIIGFSNGDSFEIDWDNVDDSKPREEWPKIYNDPEQSLKDNYVISDLDVIDAKVQAENTTTEGATMARESLTAEWLTEHGFAIGESIASPWKYEEGELYLWFEKPVEETAVDNVKEDLDVIVWFEGDELVAEGEIYLFSVNGQLLSQSINRMSVVGLPTGVYVAKTTNGVSKIVIR